MTGATDNGQPGGHADEQPATAAAMAGLAREVQALRARLEPLGGLDDRLTDLADTVTDLADEIAARDRRPVAAGAVTWLDLPDSADDTEAVGPRAAEELLEQLACWVGRVYLRYTDAAKTFPECWLWHPDVVEELTWLRHAWWAAYQVEGAAPGLAWDWHDRYRPGVVRRIRDLAGRCSLDQHTSRQTGAAPSARGLSAVDELAAWWANDRDIAPPAPSAAVLAEARAAETARLRNGNRR